MPWIRLHLGSWHMPMSLRGLCIRLQSLYIDLGPMTNPRADAWTTCRGHGKRRLRNLFIIVLLYLGCLLLAVSGSRSCELIVLDGLILVRLRTAVA